VTMLEKASRAVEDALASDDNHPDDIAKAVLMAIRDPDDLVKKKLAFGDYTTFSYGDEDSFDYLSEENVAEFSRDLIDAILTENTD